MRLRIFIPILIVLIIVAAVIAYFVLRGNTDTTDEGSDAGTAVVDGETGAAEPNEPPPTATPSLRLVPVVIAKTDLPVGERLRSDLLEIEERPDTNIALQGNYTFAEIEELIEQFSRVPISEGQAILKPMVALNPNDLAGFGSDLSLYIDDGKVAVAFPIDKYAGMAYAMRPGDTIDVLMTLRIVEVDPEFNTALPNDTYRVNEQALLAGQSFLFPKGTQGRLEFVDIIGQVVELVPSTVQIEGQDFEVGRPVPKRVTQLTIQQVEVLWVGTWRDPQELAEIAEAEAAAAAAAASAAGGAEAAVDDSVQIEGEDGAEEADGEATPEGPTPTPQPVRLEETPDVIILSLTAQDALALKWALERGVDIDFALRAQGDETVFATTSVSLPQIVEQGGLAEPQPSDFDLHPRPEEVEPPFLEPVSP